MTDDDAPVLAVIKLPRWFNDFLLENYERLRRQYPELMFGDLLASILIWGVKDTLNKKPPRYIHGDEVTVTWVKPDEEYVV